ESGSDGGTDAIASDVGIGTMCTMVPPGALSWWRAEGDPVDTLGNSTSGWMGPATYGPGVDGQAFTFAGASYVSGTLGSIDPALGGTIEAWVSLDMIPASTFDLFGFSTSGQTMDGGAVVATGLGGSWRADFQFGGQTIQGPTYGALQWVHLAITWTPAGDGGIEDVALYADGQLVGSAPVSFADAGVATSFLMGGEGAGTADMMGVLDEVTVYSGPLTPAQLQLIYVAGPGGKCQCLAQSDCSGAKPTCNAGFCQ
ncbi:MAG: LamG-like jellyroll fold domain-containing protein, partial [Acidimicrobiales bacterium]